MMNVVELNFIPFGRTVSISPYPACRYTGIPEIGYLIMGQFIITCIKYYYANSTGKDMSSIPYYIIIDSNIICNLF